MKSLSAWFLFLASFTAVGCEYNQYELELRANGPSMQRQLTCWRVRDKGNNEFELTKFSSAELRDLGKLYPEQVKTTTSLKHAFRGKFEGAMPADVGGAGSYTYLTSSLGTTAAYIERFRGNDDLDTQFYDKRQVADRMVDLLLGWLEAEMGQDPLFPAVRRLVHQDMRQDFRNIGLYCWLGNSLAATDETEAKPGVRPEPWSAAAEIHARVRQYLVERGYLLPHETIAGLQAEIQTGDGLGHLVVQRVIARKLGLNNDSDIQRALGFMSDPEKVQASITKYLETTPEFQRRLKQWETEKRKNSGASRPNANEILSELALSLLEIELSSPPDRLHLTLKVPAVPYQTNGAWDPATSTITWTRRLRENRGLPGLCTASWDEPDAKFQTAHFGQVVVTGNDLANYNIWRRAITPALGTQWDEFLAGLKPGKRLMDQLTSFEFSGPSRPKGEKIAIQGRDIVVEALKRGG